MIAKAKSITHTLHSLNYVLKKEGAEILTQHHVMGESPNEIHQEFRMIQDMNSRCTNNSLTMVISPTIEDSKGLSDAKFRTLTREFMEKMKLQNHQWVAVKHVDRKHTHIHIIANRIDDNGKAIDDTFISNRASRVGDELAISHGLHQANERRAQKEKANEKEIESIKLIHQQAKKGLTGGVGQYIDSFNRIGNPNNIRCEMYHNKSGKAQGLRFFVGDTKIKASSVDRKLSMKNLEKTLSPPLQKSVSKSNGISL